MEEKHHIPENYQKEVSKGVRSEVMQLPKKVS